MACLKELINKENDMNKTILPKACMSVLALLLCSYVIAQNSISGTISDADGESLIGANVVVKGTTDGTISDFDGSYELTTSESFPLTLVFSFTGYNTVEVVVSSASSNVNVALEEGVLLGDDVVVSASRKREKIQEAPASVSVITARKMEASPNANPIRNIVNEPGVTVQQQTAGRLNVQLRGDGGIFGSASFPIQDYRSLSGPGLGTFDVLNSPVSNIDLERIEIVRGPGSALYGPGVTSGVVHFITKSPIDRPGTTIELIGGELSTLGISARHATKVSDKFGFKINAVYKRGDEFGLDLNDPSDAARIPLFQTTVSAPGISNGVVDATLPTRQLLSASDLDPDGDGNPLQDFWKQAIGNATLEFRPQDDLSLIIAGGFNSASAIFFNSQGEGLSQAVETWAQARLQKGGFFAQTFWLNNTGGSDSSPSFLYQTGLETGVARKQIEVQLQQNFDIPSFLNSSWTAGFDYRLSIADTGHQVYGRNEEDDDFGITGGYLQSKLALGDHADLVLAGRYDRFNFLDDGAFSPRAVLVLKPSPKHTIRAGYNRAIGAPTQLQTNIDFPVASPVPGAFDIWLVGNKNEQTFSSNPQIVFNGLIPFPSIPVGTPGLPLAFAQGAVTGAPLLTAIGQGLIAANPLFTPLVPLITEFLSTRSNFVGGTTGQFAGINLFNQRPLGLLNAPSAKLRKENTWEVGYKGLIADKLGVTIDVYNRSIEGATLFTAISPSYVLLGSENIGADLGAAVGASMVPFLTQLLTPFLGGPIPDQATLEAVVAQVAGAVGAGYTQAGNQLAGTLGFLSSNGILATTPTENVPQNGVTHLAAGYRTFEKFDYTGVDVGLNYFVNNDLAFFANYSWLSDNVFTPIIQGTDGTERTSNSAPENKFRLGFNYTPEYGFRANLAFQHDNSYGAFLGQFSGDTDEKNLVDAGIGYKFDNGVMLDLTAQNLFDNEYRQFPNFPKIGRRVLGRLTYTFGDDSGGPSGMSSAGKMDSDGDGIKDSKDRCPNIAGVRKYKGCPMSEEDMAAKAAAEQAARVKAEEEARMKAEAEAKARAEAAAEAKAEAEAKARAEAEALAKAEAEAAAKAEAEAKAEAARLEAITIRDAEVRAAFAAALTGIQFNSARSTFRDESFAIMDQAVSVIQKYGDMRVLIQGHTDSQGGADANKKLSQARADAVRDYLVSKGISVSRLSTSGLGEDYPIADNNTREGRLQNRRVEFIVLK